MSRLAQSFAGSSENPCTRIFVTTPRPLATALAIITNEMVFLLATRLRQYVDGPADLWEREADSVKKRVVTATRVITATAACLLIPAFTYAAPATDQRPWMDGSLSPMKRAELLVHAMTLDEKIEQIHMADVKSRPREYRG